MCSGSSIFFRDVFKKVKTFHDLIETDSHECVTLFCQYTHWEKIKTNRPRASQICKGVIIVLFNIKDAVAMRHSDWLRAEWDHAHCYRTTGHFMTNPVPSDRRRPSDLLWRKPNLDFHRRLQDFEKRQQKKMA